MNAWVDNSCLSAVMGPEVGTLMKTFQQGPPRRLQSSAYSGPLLITDYEKCEYLRRSLAAEGMGLDILSGH